jgi:hypothetical protein
MSVLIGIVKIRPQFDPKMIPTLVRPVPSTL